MVVLSRPTSNDSGFWAVPNTPAVLISLVFFPAALALRCFFIYLGAFGQDLLLMLQYLYEILVVGGG